MMRVKKAMMVLGAVLLLFVAIILYRRMGPLPTVTDRNIAGPTVVTSQWLEIKPNFVLTPVGKTPLVILELEGNYTPDLQNQKLRFPDGTLGTPEVQLVDGQGKVFSFPCTSSWFITGIGRGLPS
jgi:hypothetical protein